MTATVWDPGLVDALLDELLHTTGLHLIRREPVRIWRLSGVERLHLSDTTTIVFKYATAPFTSEARILAALAQHRVPVPQLHAHHQHDHVLGILMADLGPPTRTATDTDAAHAAARLHTTPILETVPAVNTADLAVLPQQCLTHLAELRRQHRFPHTHDLTHLLTDLAAIADQRSRDAQLAPFGTCHGELHPTSIHISHAGWRLIDFGKTFTGPGLLDLATWFGTRTLVDPHRMHQLIRRYITAGGHPAAATDRGGLPAAVWALGWHRIHSAAWFLTHATLGHHTPDTDNHHLAIIRRQLTAAHTLLTEESYRSTTSARCR